MDRPVPEAPWVLYLLPSGNNESFILFLSEWNAGKQEVEAYRKQLRLVSKALGGLPLNETSGPRFARTNDVLAAIITNSEAT